MHARIWGLARPPPREQQADLSEAMSSRARRLILSDDFENMQIYLKR